MNKLSFIKKPELFQGEKYLNTNKNYFEGWYFKNTNNKGGISFIPGININKNNKKAFIQVITENSSYFVNYDINNKEYKFTTYNNSKLIENEINNKFINITLKKGNYYLNVKSTYNKGLKLLAPVKGKMQKNILENICSKITINLKYKYKLIFSDTSNNCGLEIVK